MSVVHPEHTTVLLNSAIESLLRVDERRQREREPQQDAVIQSGVYIDATFGRGGHSQRLLDRLDENSRLIAFDQDPEAVAVGGQWSDPRFEMVHASFADLEEVIRLRGLWGGVQGVLFDLGVSSPQLDQAERGFSFQQEGPLDMRMDTSQGETAAEWLAEVSVETLTQVLKEYGEERFAKRIARAIAKRRAVEPITTTKQLSDLIVDTIPREKHKHPATRSFQAIRIAINQELTVLPQALESALNVLAPGGRLVVISFHSLEDRVVKRYFQQQQKGDHFPRDMPVTQDQMKQRLKVIGKAVKPSSEEIEMNPRARSAVMRIAEKTAAVV